MRTAALALALLAAWMAAPATAEPPKIHRLSFRAGAPCDPNLAIPAGFSCEVDPATQEFWCPANGRVLLRFDGLVMIESLTDLVYPRECVAISNASRLEALCVGFTASGWVALGDWMAPVPIGALGAISADRMIACRLRLP